MKGQMRISPFFHAPEFVMISSKTAFFRAATSKTTSQEARCGHNGQSAI